MNNNEQIAWLAGLLEGEGCFMNGYKTRPNQSAISVEMKDKDIIERIANMWNAKFHPCKPRKDHHSITYKVHIRGEKAREVMKKVLPFMGIRRSKKIQKILESAAQGGKRS